MSVFVEFEFCRLCIPICTVYVRKSESHSFPLLDFPPKFVYASVYGDFPHFFIFPVCQLYFFLLKILYYHDLACTCCRSPFGHVRAYVVSFDHDKILMNHLLMHGAAVAAELCRSCCPVSVMTSSLIHCCVYSLSREEGK